MNAAVLIAAAVLLAGCNAGPKVVIREANDPVPARGPAMPASNWEYKAEEGDSWACARSVDNAAELCFRRSRGHLDSYLHLPREGNPFFCSHGRCETRVNIDGAEQTVQGTDAEGGGTRILFLPAPERLLQQMEHAKHVSVKPPMFGVDQEFVFEVAGLKQP